eukprot:1585089-Prymnesium_polylepis.1
MEPWRKRSFRVGTWPYACCNRPSPPPRIFSVAPLQIFCMCPRTYHRKAPHTLPCRHELPGAVTKSPHLRHTFIPRVYNISKSRFQAHHDGQ